MRNASSRFTHVADAMTTRPVAHVDGDDRPRRSRGGRQAEEGGERRAESAHRRLASLVERWWLDPEIAQVDVALAAMMDLVVDDVEQQRVNRHLPLAERGVDFLKAARRESSATAG